MCTTSSSLFCRICSVFQYFFPTFEKVKVTKHLLQEPPCHARNNKTVIFQRGYLCISFMVQTSHWQSMTMKVWKQQPEPKKEGPVTPCKAELAVSASHLLSGHASRSLCRLPFSSRAAANTQKIFPHSLLQTVVCPIALYLSRSRLQPKLPSPTLSFLSPGIFVAPSRATYNLFLRYFLWVEGATHGVQKTGKS